MNWLLSLLKKKHLITQLDERLTTLEKDQKKMQQIIIDKCWHIDKLIIEKMQTEKFEFNLDSIDVKDLSGMLSIGLNSGCELVKKEYKDHKKQPCKQNRLANKKDLKNNTHPSGAPPKINIRY